MNNKSINRNRNRKEIVKHIIQVAQSLSPQSWIVFSETWDITNLSVTNWMAESGE